jgi:hypothetical protein
MKADPATWANFIELLCLYFEDKSNVFCLSPWVLAQQQKNASQIGQILSN